VADAAPNRLGDVLAAQFRTKVGLARALGVSRTTVNNWISGEEAVPVGRREEIAAVLQVPVSEVFPEEGVVA
jgi:transcriptional regulator with XRE-family HTH domain